VFWKVESAKVGEPLPRRHDGLPDYFAYDPANLVQAGELLATLPPESGALAAQLDNVLVAGPGVRLSADRQRYLANVDGFAELIASEITVVPFECIPGDLPAGDYEFKAGCIVLGNVRAANIRVAGPLAVGGTIAGGSIRAGNTVYVGRAARAKILAAGSVYVVGTLLHCEVNSRKKLIALDSASMVGGSLVAAEGVIAIDLGSPDGVPTRVTVGLDRYTNFHLDELESEIRACEANVSLIAQALRPLTAAGAGPIPESKRQLVQRLTTQRDQLEQRARELHNKKRNLIMGLKMKIDGIVTVAGTVYPGVTVTIHDAATALTDMYQNVAFVEEPKRKVVEVQPLAKLQAA
jgi:uncharacterized protein (DUF342 family)